ncbi:MAG TPA: AAA family ATPase [Opitutaceae bacterium]
MDGRPLRLVISGGPGAGKTTLLDALRREGWPCHAEVSRAIIEEQHASGGRLYPWEDMAGFAAECVTRMRRQVRASSAHPVSFFDRALPDVIAYLRHRSLQPDAELFEAARDYTPLAFIAPPWPQIYACDAARPQRFEEAQAIHAQIVRAYSDCGFVRCELPRSSVAARVEFVHQQIERYVSRS